MQAPAQKSVQERESHTKLDTHPRTSAWNFQCNRFTSEKKLFTKTEPTGGYTRDFSWVLLRTVSQEDIAMVKAAQTKGPPTPGALWRV